MGSTRILTDLDGNVVADYNYEAFGELLDSTGDVENNYLFAGEQFDGDLGQYYLRDRYYDQNVGRFTRRDVYEGRLNEPITLHKYLYANANPVYYTDPTGLFSSVAELTQSISTIGALAAIGGVAGIMTQGEPLQPLGGFGDGPQPDLPRDTAHRNLIAKILDFGRLRGFGDGPQPGLPNHTGRSPDHSLYSLIRYVFASSYSPEEKAYDIGYGHAWSKHFHDSWVPLGINNEQELSERIYDILTGSYDKIKVDGNKTIYLGFDGTIVIDNPGDPDGGTAFNPNMQQGNNTGSRDYFNKQRGMEQ